MARVAPLFDVSRHSIDYIELFLVFMHASQYRKHQKVSLNELLDNYSHQYVGLVILIAMMFRKSFKT